MLTKYLEAAAVAMAQQIAAQGDAAPRPVYLSATLRSLHQFNRGPDSAWRRVGVYTASGFDMDQFREDIAVVYREGLARRRPRVRGVMPPGRRGRPPKYR